MFEEGRKAFDAAGALASGVFYKILDLRKAFDIAMVVQRQKSHSEGEFPFQWCLMSTVSSSTIISQAQAYEYLEVCLYSFVYSQH